MFIQPNSCRNSLHLWNVLLGKTRSHRSNRDYNDISQIDFRPVRHGDCVRVRVLLLAPSDASPSALQTHPQGPSRMDSARGNNGNLRSLDRFVIYFFDSVIADLKLTVLFSEHIVSNLMPVVISIISVNAPLSTSWVYFTITTVTTLGDHSGYHLPFLHSPEFHDFHHLKFVECFGAAGFLDSFHNTRQKFDESVHALRHKTLFTLKAANELYPDVNKKSH